MQGFLWLLIQMALLLLAAAIIFFWLGWRWRGQNANARIADLNAQIDAESRAAESARRDRETAQAAMGELKSSQLREAADLQEAQDRLRGLEREILRLADDLKAAREQNQPLETSAMAAAPASPETAAPPLTQLEIALPSPEQKALLPTKEPRPKKPAAKTAKIVNGRNVLKRLEKSLATQATLVETLRAKHAECELRLEESKSQKDRAALRSATKNLAQSSSELTAAIEALASRERQIRAITRSLGTPINGSEDDLTRIKGVKGPINDQLRSLGVRTYRQIALWSDEDASAFGELLAIKKNATRDLWRIQARELHRAKHGTEPSS